MNSNGKALVKTLMTLTDYKIFKCMNTKGNRTQISMTVPKKCTLYYKDKSERIAKMNTSTKSALNQFSQFNANVFNNMGVLSKLCTVDLVIENIDNRISVQKLEFLQNDRYYIFIDSIPVMCITKFHNSKYAEDLEVYDSLQYIGSMKNNIANIIIDVHNLVQHESGNNLQKYTEVTFAVYKLRTSDIIHLEDVSYTIPFILLTEDYNYNHATLQRLYDKVYEEYLEQ